ncbi:hypothetical protein XA68_11584 [Ophiocordyceps unilateralis]|uniref:Uncharacterized protein n=1 Tax=Ophiocordyceps unilateralis TaxID=268505 RepID=A0A2A9PG54_OPHUN|nr:hypothetical protein XA68_11584 [Ophiocordyceps unilateralis]
MNDINSAPPLGEPPLASARATQPFHTRGVLVYGDAQTEYIMCRLACRARWLFRAACIRDEEGKKPNCFVSRRRTDFTLFLTLDGPPRKKPWPILSRMGSPCVSRSRTWEQFSALRVRHATQTHTHTDLRPKHVTKSRFDGSRKLLFPSPFRLSSRCSRVGDGRRTAARYGKALPAAPETCIRID